ncbi:MAG: hypothetical protein JWM93_25 [Frankiales bacterium]|nr:hypothetical protein [Frankiales bacterium]
MSDDIDRALDAVVATARAHLTAVRAHGTEATETMDAYDACADAAAAYERLLSEQFDESAPWAPELDELDEEDLADGIAMAVGDVSFTGRGPSEEEWVAVRVRADYFVEDEDSLFAAADAAAVAAGLTEWTPVRAVGDAFAVLLGSAAPVIGSLDVPGIQRGNGTSTVHVTNYPLVDADMEINADEQVPFVMSRDQLVAVVPDPVPDDLDDDGEGGEGRSSGGPWRPDAPLTPAEDPQSLLGWALGRDRY